MSQELQDAFLREVADAVRTWTESGTTTMAGSDDPAHDRLAWGDSADAWKRLRSSLSDEQKEDFAAVLQSCLAGLAHTLLVVLDGGTKLSDRGRSVFLTDEKGERIGEGLHERLPEYLDEL